MGEFYALLCTVIWSFAVILLQRATENASPVALNLFRSSVSVPLLFLTLAVTGTPLLREAPVSDYVILIASGVLGIAVADTLFHKALQLAGAGVNAIVSTAYSPLVALMAFLMIDERLAPLDLVGMLLILSSLLLAATLQPSGSRTQTHLWKGIGVGLAEMVFLAFSIVLAKPVLNHSPVLWATTVRQTGAFAALILLTLASPGRRRTLALYRPSPHWRFMVPGAALGSYLSLIFWIAGMKYTQASIAAMLNQTSTIMILILAVIFLGEPFTRRKAVAAGFAVVGVLLITLF